MGTALNAQQNPFELEFRLNNNVENVPEPEEDKPLPDTERISLAVTDSISHTSTDTQASANERLEQMGDKPTPIVEKEKQGKGNTEIPLPPILQKKRNLIFATFLILFIMLTIVISLNRAVVDHVIRAVMNDNYLNLLYRQQKGRLNIQYIFLSFFFVANIGFFIFISMDYWLKPRPNVTLLTCIIIVGLVYYIRYLTMRLLATTFPVSKEARQFNFTIIVFNIMLGIIIFPVNLFLAFAPDKISTIAFYTGLIIYLIFYLFRQMRGLFIGARLINSYKFHFFIYLCTIEIAPIVVGVKVFLNLTT